MRFPTARLVVAAVLVVAGGCANRGMVAPSDAGAGGASGLGGAAGQAAGGHAGGGGRGGQGGMGGAAGAAGTRGTAGAGGKGGAGTAGTGGQGGMAGTPATGGSGGTGMRDAGCSMTDAHADRPSHCTSLFSFEAGVQGAVLGPDQQAFTRVQDSSANTFCGTGALAITAAFSGTTGLGTKGEIDIPLGVDGGSANLTGKTLTIHASATGTCGTDLKLTAVLVTSTGSLFPLRNVPLTTGWTTSTAVLSTDAGSGISSAISLAIDVSSFTGYSGTVYLDEIDIN